jgi:hypothetical protein
MSSSFCDVRSAIRHARDQTLRIINDQYVKPGVLRGRGHKCVIPEEMEDKIIDFFEKHGTGINVSALMSVKEIYLSRPRRKTLPGLKKLKCDDDLKEYEDFLAVFTQLQGPELTR